MFHILLGQGHFYAQLGWLLRPRESTLTAIRCMQSKNRVPFSRDWYVLGAESSFLRSNASISTGGVERPPPPSFQSSQRSPR